MCVCVCDCVCDCVCVYVCVGLLQERGLLFKCVVLLIWGKTCLNKYIGSWMLTVGFFLFYFVMLPEDDTEFFSGCGMNRYKLCKDHGLNRYRDYTWMEW